MYSILFALQSFNLAQHTLPSVLTPGSQVNRKGSGCFKLSAGENTRMAAAGRAATKKLNVQQKSASGKVGLPKHLYIKLEVRPGWLKYPKKIAKKSFKGKSVKAPVK